ncbi:hypothetical protein [Bradyrhizobium sp. WD16]|uniref:hypothetical protein n=1 Tax=Bradyrhizobium sp. WD16 TaxID=1521768 RepID=UPI0020A3149A|nr:hypothetical protein [Bradyrhizobium sp. WD16]
MASSMHVYLNWAKERIDEMDALLASLESRANEVKAESRAAADQLMADLRKKRAEFDETLKQQTQAGEAAWERGKTQLEAEWNGFQTEVKRYVDVVGQQLKQQQATFQDVAAAQLKAWREAADKFNAAAADFAADRRADLDTTVAQMKAEASEAEANFQKLKQAGTESWAALNAALTESRAAFDRANQAAWDALKRTRPGA